jgi:predicted DNA-binding protein (UPF0251 family)
MRKTIVSVLVLVSALFTVGAAAAATNCGPGGGGDSAGGASTSKFVSAAASQLGVSRATLVSAIQSSANATIDAAVASGDITSAQAADEKQEVADNLDKAYRLSTTSGVATKLGISTSALDSGFNAARKSVLNAQIDAALAAGKITSDQATAQKAKVAALTTGYKASGTAQSLGLRARQH